MAKVSVQINRQALKKIESHVNNRAMEYAVELRDKVYDTLYSLSSAIIPFENEYGIAVKTGALRRSITPVDPVRVDKNLIETEVYFDTQVAPHAVFVLEGTEKMPARPIHLVALELIRMQMRSL